MLNSSEMLTHFVPPVLSSAIFTTFAAGSDAPKDPDALDEKLLNRARYTSCASSNTRSTVGGNNLDVLLNLPLLSDIEW